MMKSSVLITGANGAIGRVLVSTFASNGWRVIATDCGDTGPSEAYDYVTADLLEIAGSPKACAGFVKGVHASIAECPLRCLINNAALQITGPVSGLGEEDLRLSLDVNVVAPFILSKSFSNRLAETAGVILNMTSVHQIATKQGFLAYAVSKAAMAALTRSLALDLAPKVRVISVAPAAVDTPMLRAGFANKEEFLSDLCKVHPLERVGMPDEVARMALMLASDAASFMTGSTVFVDGGVLACLHDPV